MLNEIDILKDVSQKLSTAGIPFMLTGSMALNYYATPRMTRDIDVVVAVSPQDTGKIMGIFQGEYYISEEAKRESLERESMFNIIHMEGVIKVDFMILTKQEYRLAEFERRKKIKVQDFETFVVSKEDLILSKWIWSKESGSALQKQDIQALLNTGCDRTYLRRWMKKLNLDERFLEMAP